MARPMKEGADYFPLDVDIFQNRKVMLVKNKLGFASLSVIVALFAEIYGGKGYYLYLDEDECALMAERIGGGCDAEYVLSVANTCVTHGLFDEILYKKYKILTSKGIQKRYLKIMELRKTFKMNTDYLLVDINDRNVTTEKTTKKISLVKTDEAEEKAFIPGEGVNCPINPVQERVNCPINPQKKVNKNKLNKTKVNDVAVEYEGVIGQTEFLHDIQQQQQAIYNFIPKTTERAVADALVTKLLEWTKVFPTDVIGRAIEESLENSAFSYKYICIVLKNWQDLGLRDLESVDRHISNWKNPVKRDSKAKKGKYFEYKGRDWDYAKLEELAMNHMMTIGEDVQGEQEKDKKGVT